MNIAFIQEEEVFKKALDPLLAKYPRWEVHFYDTPENVVWNSYDVVIIDWHLPGECGIVHLFDMATDETSTTEMAFLSKYSEWGEDSNIEMAIHCNLLNKSNLPEIEDFLIVVEERIKIGEKLRQLEIEVERERGIL